MMHQASYVPSAPDQANSKYQGVPHPNGEPQTHQVGPGMHASNDPRQHSQNRPNYSNPNNQNMTLRNRPGEPAMPFPPG